MFKKNDLTNELATGYIKLGQLGCHHGVFLDPEVGKQALLLKAVLSTRAGLDAQVYT